MGSNHLRVWVVPATLRPSVDVNVTPLIDILLVLLIIFLAALPLTQQGLEVNLPVPRPADPSAPPSPHVMLDYAVDGSLTINSQPVELASLEARLRDVFAFRQDRTLYVRADGRLRYGQVITVIDAARGAGVQRIGVVTPESYDRQGPSAPRASVDGRGISTIR